MPRSYAKSPALASFYFRLAFHGAPFNRSPSSLRNTLPVEAETVQILSEPVGVVRAGLFGARSAEKLAPCLRERPRFPARFDHSRQLHAIEEIDAIASFPRQ